MSDEQIVYDVMFHCPHCDELVWAIINGERADCECPCCCKRIPVTVSIERKVTDTPSPT